MQYNAGHFLVSAERCLCACAFQTQCPQQVVHVQSQVAHALVMLFRMLMCIFQDAKHRVWALAAVL